MMPHVNGILKRHINIPTEKTCMFITCMQDCICEQNTRSKFS